MTKFKKKIISVEIIPPEWAPWTRKVISSIIPMFNLTIEGIEEAMDYLRKSGKDFLTTVQILRGFKY